MPSLAFLPSSLRNIKICCSVAMLSPSVVQFHCKSSQEQKQVSYFKASSFAYVGLDSSFGS